MSYRVVLDDPAVKVAIAMPDDVLLTLTVALMRIGEDPYDPDVSAPFRPDGPPTARTTVIDPTLFAYYTVDDPDQTVTVRSIIWTG